MDTKRTTKKKECSSTSHQQYYLVEPDGVEVNAGEDQEHALMKTLVRPVHVSAARLHVRHADLGLVMLRKHAQLDLCNAEQEQEQQEEERQE